MYFGFIGEGFGANGVPVRSNFKIDEAGDDGLTVWAAGETPQLVEGNRLKGVKRGVCLLTNRLNDRGMIIHTTKISQPHKRFDNKVVTWSGKTVDRIYDSLSRNCNGDFTVMPYVPNKDFAGAVDYLMSLTRGLILFEDDVDRTLIKIDIA